MREQKAIIAKIMKSYTSIFSLNLVHAKLHANAFQDPIPHPLFLADKDAFL